MVTYGSIVFTLQFLFFSATPVPLFNQKNCNWEESGETADDKSISVTQLNCREGFIRWTKPHGGKRILITPKDVKGEFKVCFTSSHRGVNIYTEKGNKLILLQDYRKTNDLPVCFDSYEKVAVLYFENEEKRNAAVEVKFTIHARGKQAVHKHPEECKPCNDDQIKESICKGDFVVRGYLKTYITLSDGITAQANITAKEVISQRRNIFTKDKTTDRYSLGSVKVPSTCSWLTRNAHMHIFTGLVIPGRGPVLACRIKQATWKYYSQYLCPNSV